MRFANAPPDQETAEVSVLLLVRPAYEGAVLFAVTFRSHVATEPLQGIAANLEQTLTDSLSVPADRHVCRTGDGHDVAEPLFLAETAEFVVRTIDLVRGHPGGWNAFCQGSRQHLPGQDGLRRERCVIGDFGFPPSCLVIGPVLRKGQSPINEGMAARATVREKHADLTVLDSSRRSRVLPLHANGLCALLEEAGLIHNQHGVRVAEAFDNLEHFCLWRDCSFGIG